MPLNIPKVQRPNILLLYTDQQRLDSLGCYGSDFVDTPNIDRLAAQGARFDNIYVQAPVCMPSRMSFLTGRYCSSLGIGTNGIPLPEGTTTIATLLGRAGYETLQIGKLHFLPHARRDHREPHPAYDFDTCIISDEPGCYDDAYIKWVEQIAPDQVDKVRVAMPAPQIGQKPNNAPPRNTHQPYIFEADDHLTHSAFVASEVSRALSAPRANPFFCIAGFYAPHAPLNVPASCLDRVDPANVPLPQLGDDEIFDEHLKNLSPDDWRKVVHYYHAFVSHVDDCVGQILDTLEATGQLDNTIIIFTTDHGEFLGDHGKVQKWMPGHDCITRVPFIMRYPAQIEAGTAVGDLVEAVDWLPTMLDYAGIQPPAHLQGRSLRPTLEGRETQPREDIMVEGFDPGGFSMATVKTKEWMYSLGTDGTEYLYDRASDPGERNNLIGPDAPLDVLADMRKRLVIRQQRARYTDHNKTAPY